MLRIETRNSTYLLSGATRTVVALSGTHAGRILTGVDVSVPLVGLPLTGRHDDGPLRTTDVVGITSVED